MQPDKIFKAYDIRGRIDNGELDEELYRRVGWAMVDLLGCDRIAIGRDCRASSKVFAEAMAEGVTAAGADVADLGEVPTDAVYYYSGAAHVPGAVITASHNPPQYNGLKLCGPGAAPIGEETGLTEIKEKVMAGPGPSRSGNGTVERLDVVDDYIDHLFKVVPADTIGSLRVAVDGGNGMAGIAVERVFDRLSAHLTGLYLEPDGTFPNHPANPLVPENLEDLRKLMDKGDFDLGVAFDGDADRAFFLDDRSEPLSGSTVTSLIAKRMLKARPGASIVHNLITSRAVPEIVEENGGVPIRTRVGHSFIKQVMAQTGAVFGGEHSGHYYFLDNYRADSGMLAMLCLMSVMTEEDQPMSLLRTTVERYAASGEINFEVSDQAAAMNAVEQEMAEARVDRLDGLTLDFDDAWLNLRPSNTEPLLRLNVEAADEGAVEELVGRVSAILRAT